MKIKLVTLWFVLSIILISSCTIDINQPAGVSTTAFPQGNITLPPSATVLPITWGNLHLSGKMIYPSAVLQNDSASMGVRLLDLATGIVTTIFYVPDGGWVDAI